MSQGINDLIAGLTVSMSDEDIALYGLEGIICGEILSQRIKRNMNQKQFAEFMGVSQSMVSKWERCECNFTLSSLVHIASKLDIEIQSPFVSQKSEFMKSRKVVPLPTAWNTTISYTSTPFEPIEELKEM